jgi:CBS domain-containing protein
VQQWQVSDVMTTPVITTPEHTPVRELVGIMSTHRVSAVPIVDDDDRVVGLVSQADLLPKVAATAAPGARAARRRTAAKAAATSARDLMSTPVLSISADAPLSAAANTMQATSVKRLLVTDPSGQLLGIVSRTDLLRPYTRPDTAIRQDVIDHVLRRVLWIDPGQVQVHVDAGIVTLTGDVGRRTTAAIAARLTARVPGVVAVINQIRDTFDDTDLARSRTHRTHPFSAEPFNPRQRINRLSWGLPNFPASTAGAFRHKLSRALSAPPGTAGSPPQQRATGSAASVTTTASDDSDWRRQCGHRGRRRRRTDRKYSVA